MDFVSKVLTVLFGYVTLFYEVRGFHNDIRCGQNYDRNPKILGGEKLTEGEFPWYVSIKETGQHGCGGLIINSQTVLTAAHCFKDFSDRATDSPKTISVTLASHYLNQNHTNNQISTFSKWEQDVKVKKIIRHPLYNAFSEFGKSDIALLLLENKITWNKATRPVCLPTNYSNTNSQFGKKQDFEFKNGEIAIVAGWSSHAKTGSDGENILHKVRLTLYNNDECRRIMTAKNITLKSTDQIDSSVICAGSHDIGFDSCSGDSGSGLLVQRNGAWMAIGIVSSGFGKCGNGRPGLYTRISSYMDWIEKYVPN